MCVCVSGFSDSDPACAIYLSMCDETVNSMARSDLSFSVVQIQWRLFSIHHGLERVLGTVCICLLSVHVASCQKVFVSALTRSCRGLQHHI